MGWFRSTSSSSPDSPNSEGSGRPSGGSSSTLQRLIQFLADESMGELRAEAINPDVHIYDAGYVDSMRSSDLLVFLDKELGVSIPEAKLVGSLSTLSALCEYVDTKRAKGL